jgi:GNAT superfamily N-acetyltransferase
MTAAACTLEPVDSLGSAATAAVRRIYEQGFPSRLRAGFATLTRQRQAGEMSLALVRDGQPRGFAVLRPLGETGWVFLRYFVVDERLRGQGLGGIMWHELAALLRADGYTLLVFDVEDPAEPGCGAVQARIRSRRIGFYQRHGAGLLPVHGYRTPHGSGWAPMLLLTRPATGRWPAGTASSSRSTRPGARCRGALGTGRRSGRWPGSRAKSGAVEAARADRLLLALRVDLERHRQLSLGGHGAVNFT